MSSDHRVYPGAPAPDFYARQRERQEETKRRRSVDAQRQERFEKALRQGVVPEALDLRTAPPSPFALLRARNPLPLPTPHADDHAAHLAMSEPEIADAAAQPQPASVAGGVRSARSAATPAAPTLTPAAPRAQDEAPQLPPHTPTPAPAPVPAPSLASSPASTPTPPSAPPKPSHRAESRVRNETCPPVRDLAEAPAAARSAIAGQKAPEAPAEATHATTDAGASPVASRLNETSPAATLNIASSALPTPPTLAPESSVPAATPESSQSHMQRSEVLADVPTPTPAPAPAPSLRNEDAGPAPRLATAHGLESLEDLFRKTAESRLRAPDEATRPPRDESLPLQADSSTHNSTAVPSSPPSTVPMPRAAAPAAAPPTVWPAPSSGSAPASGPQESALQQVGRQQLVAAAFAASSTTPTTLNDAAQGIAPPVPVPDRLTQPPALVERPQAEPAGTPPPVRNLAGLLQPLPWADTAGSTPGANVVPPPSARSPDLSRETTPADAAQDAPPKALETHSATPAAKADPGDPSASQPARAPVRLTPAAMADALDSGPKADPIASGLASMTAGTPEDSMALDNADVDPAVDDADDKPTASPPQVQQAAPPPPHSDLQRATGDAALMRAEFAVPQNLSAVAPDPRGPRKEVRVSGATSTRDGHAATPAGDVHRTQDGADVPIFARLPALDGDADAGAGGYGGGRPSTQLAEPADDAPDATRVTPFDLFGQRMAPAPVHGNAAASPVPAPTPAPAEVRLQHRISEIVERLMVGDGQQGGRQVRMDLKEDLLPGVTITIQELDGRLEVDFNCAQEVARKRLADAAPDHARMLAIRLERDVLLRVQTGEENDPERLEVVAAPPNRRRTRS